jgi:hypothetical protein
MGRLDKALRRRALHSRQVHEEAKLPFCDKRRPRLSLFFLSENRMKP